MLRLLRKRRSIRRYQPQKVPSRIIRALQETLLRAPSSRDLRPWEFFFITDKPLLDRLSQCKEHGSAFLAKAPLGIVICGDETIADTWVEDCSIAAILVQMAALDLGLGSCWIQVRMRKTAVNTDAEAYVRTALGLPEQMRVLCIIALGYPAEKKPAVPAKNLRHSAIHQALPGKASSPKRTSR